MEFDDIVRLLDEFSSLPLPAVDKTILEIAGYPHYENAASNILAFFLNPKNGHGLKRIVFESLLAAAGRNKADAGSGEIIIEREAGAGSGRLDLVVETDHLTVGLENKIFAGVDNDLADYAKSVRDKAAQVNKQPLLILLTLHAVDVPADALSGFQPLTYETFFDTLMPRAGPLLPGAPPRYVNYLLDFVRTIQNLRRSEVPSVIRKFVRDNTERLAALQKDLASLRGEIDQKLDDVSGRIDVSNRPPLYSLIGPRPYNEEWPGRFTRVRYWMVDVPLEKELAVNLRLCPKGWEVVAFRIGESDIANLLAARGVNSASFQLYPTRRLCGEFDYDEDPGKVANKVQLVIDALRQPQTHQHSGNLPSQPHDHEEWQLTGSGEQ